ARRRPGAAGGFAPRGPAAAGGAVRDARGRGAAIWRSLDRPLVRGMAAWRGGGQGGETPQIRRVILLSHTAFKARTRLLPRYPLIGKPVSRKVFLHRIE